LFDGKDWFTPKLPLLRGTCRTALIDNGIIKEKDIRPEELSSYSFVRLFNAMIKWGALEFSTGTIYG
jgi:Aminotransferase class IV.